MQMDLKGQVLLWSTEQNTRMGIMVGTQYILLEMSLQLTNLFCLFLSIFINFGVHLYQSRLKKNQLIVITRTFLL